MGRYIYIARGESLCPGEIKMLKEIPNVVGEVGPWEVISIWKWNLDFLLILSPCLHHAGANWEDSCLQPRKKARTWPWWCYCFDLVSVKNNFLLVKLPSLWNVAAQAQFHQDISLDMQSSYTWLHLRRRFYFSMYISSYCAIWYFFTTCEKVFLQRVKKMAEWKHNEKQWLEMMMPRCIQNLGKVDAMVWIWPVAHRSLFWKLAPHVHCWGRVFSREHAC